MYKCHICGAPLDYPGHCPDCGERPVRDWMDDKMLKGEKMDDREEKFTPGPWRVCWDRDMLRFDIVWSETGDIIGHANDRADARLISAAPEMYEMLDFLLEFVKNGGNEGEIRECYASAIHALLKKARGEE